MIRTSMAQTVQYAHNVYKGETKVSPFFFSNQRLISLRQTTNCNKSRILA